MLTVSSGSSTCTNAILLATMLPQMTYQHTFPYNVVLTQSSQNDHAACFYCLCMCLYMCMCLCMHLSISQLRSSLCELPNRAVRPLQNNEL